MSGPRSKSPSPTLRHNWRRTPLRAGGKVNKVHRMGGNAMTGSQHSGREFLRTTAALTATASFGAVAVRAAAQGGPAQSRSQIDAVLRRGGGGKEVPGGVAVGAHAK